MKATRVTNFAFTAAIALLAFTGSLYADFEIMVNGGNYQEITEIEYLGEIFLEIVPVDKSAIGDDFALILSADNGTFGPDCKSSVLITSDNIKNYSPVSFYYESETGLSVIHLKTAMEMVITSNGSEITVPPLTEIFQVAIFDMTFDMTSGTDSDSDHDALALSFNYDTLNDAPPVIPVFPKPTLFATSSLKTTSLSTSSVSLSKTTFSTLAVESDIADVSVSSAAAETSILKPVYPDNSDWAEISYYNPQDGILISAGRQKVQPISSYVDGDSDFSVKLQSKDLSVDYLADSDTVSASLASESDSLVAYSTLSGGTESGTVMALSTSTLPSTDQWRSEIDLDNCVYIEDHYLESSQTWSSDNTYIITDPPFIISDAKTLNIPSGTQIYYYFNDPNVSVNVFEVENGGILRTDYLVPGNPKANAPVTILSLTDNQEQIYGSIAVMGSASPDCMIRNNVIADAEYGIYVEAQLNTFISDNYIFHCDTGITAIGSNTIFNNLCARCGGSKGEGSGIGVSAYVLDIGETIEDLNIDSIDYEIYNNTILNSTGNAINIQGIDKIEDEGVPEPNVYIEKNYTSGTKFFSYYFGKSTNRNGIFWPGFSNYSLLTNIDDVAILFDEAVENISHTPANPGVDGNWEVYLNPSEIFVSQVKYENYIDVMHSVKTDFDNIYSSTVTDDGIPTKDGAIGKHNYVDFTGTLYTITADIAPKTPDKVVDQQDLDLLNSVFMQTVPTYTEIDEELLDPDAVGDFIADYVVDLYDFAYFANLWETLPDPNDPNNMQCDINGDQWIGLDDFALFAEYFGYVIPTITNIQEGADPNVVKADINGDYIVDQLDRDIVLAQMGHVQVSTYTPDINASFKSLSDPDYQGTLDWTSLKGVVEVEVQPVDDVDKIDVFIYKDRIGIMLFDSIDNYNTFKLNTQNYVPGTYDILFNLHYIDGSVSKVKQQATFTNTNIHSVNIPTLLDEDSYRIQFCNGTESTQVTVTDIDSGQVLHNTVYSGYDVEVVFDSTTVASFGKVAINLEALNASDSPDAALEVTKYKMLRNSDVVKDFELLISMPDQEMNSNVANIIDDVTDACYLASDPETLVVPYKIYNEQEFNWSNFKSAVKDTSMKHWVNFSDGNYDYQNERTFTSIWKKVPGTIDSYYKTRLYSFPWQTDDMYVSKMALESCYLSDLELKDSGKLQFVYNLACKSGVTYNDYGSYNDFADACGSYSDDSVNYQAYFGFHDNYTAFDNVSDFYDWLSLSENFHEVFFQQLRLRDEAVFFSLEKTIQNCDTQAAEVIQGYDSAWDGLYNDTKVLNQQDNLRIYPWEDLGSLYLD